MADKNRRIIREKKTVEAMIHLYCRSRHRLSEELCSECRVLLDYARERLNRCPFQENKTTCAQCRIQCYKPGMKEKIREVMKYAGPRMTCRHPLLALSHFIDGFRKEPVYQKHGQVR